MVFSTPTFGFGDAVRSVPYFTQNLKACKLIIGEY